MTPLVVRGAAPVLSWTPQRILPASDDTMMRLVDLYRHTDPELARAIEGRMGAREHGARRRGMNAMDPTEGQPHAGRVRRPGARLFRRGRRHRGEIFGARPTARASARSRSTAGTPTSTRALASGRLATLLGALDGAFAAVETAMGEAWRETVVGGRHRVRPHRAHQRHQRHRPRHRHGGAARRRCAQGRPRDRRLAGLSSPLTCYEGRDLKATTDLGAVLKGVAQGPPARRASARLRRRCFRTAATSRRWRGWWGRGRAGSSDAQSSRPGFTQASISPRFLNDARVTPGNSATRAPWSGE